VSRSADNMPRDTRILIVIVRHRSGAEGAQTPHRCAHCLAISPFAFAEDAQQQERFSRLAKRAGVDSRSIFHLSTSDFKNSLRRCALLCPLVSTLALA
jgi:hypothetical protein